ncbi:MAG: hypothetical protein LC797_10775 [Chloroflexi bacterium]|nr:hypothetical protein [Chloroflexota bacterium]
MDPAHTLALLAERHPIERAHHQHLTALADDLLLRVRAVSPTAFEKLVVQLLLAMATAARSRMPGKSLAGLMSNVSDVVAHHRRAAYKVDRILRGVRPADLPIELPTAFEFLVNLKTAQTLGITFPPEVAAQVTEWGP